MMFDAMFPIASQKIESQAVLFVIINFQQFRLEQFPFCRIHFTFKNGFLHSDTVVDTFLRDKAKAASPETVYR